ncbi:hypothetical protein TRVL_04682 [Trypanosoma vivax]|nr:hypothetical protein TRVL_04682 [Trypanosoma vivax]
MPSSHPGVRQAMALVSRRMKLRRVQQRRPGMAGIASPFVSPRVEKLSRELPSLDAHSVASPDLSLALSSIISSAASNTAVTMHQKTVLSSHRTQKTADTSGVRATRQQNITLDASIIKRVADAANIEGTIQLAQSLLGAMRKGGDFGKLLHAIMTKREPATLQEVELRAGIGATLGHSGDSRRRTSLRGFRLLTSDVQIAEVLPNGKIVTLTRPTLPTDAEAIAAAIAHVCTTLLNGKAVEVQYVHFVLYKERLSLREAFVILSEASEGFCAPSDFSANVALEESAVTVQSCSLRLSIPMGASQETYCSELVRKLLRVNMRPLPLSLEVVGGRAAACDPGSSVNSRMQCSMLVRGVTAGGRGQLEKRALSALSLFPNFFGPRHFGPDCPFLTYHAAAAWERNRPAEALVMAASIDCCENAGIVRDWVKKLADLLQREEDRPAVLREWYQLHVPSRLKAQIGASKGALLWNVFASCRVHEMRGIAVDGSPDVGDCVLLHDGSGAPAEPSVVKAELFPEWLVDESISTRSMGVARRNGDVGGARFIASEEEASSHTLRDIVIPFHAQNDAMASALALCLGFRPPTHPLCRNVGASSEFRRLFVTGSGHPWAHRPWVKVLPEPVNAFTENEGAVHKLLSDMELRQHFSYATASRGHPRAVRAIDKYGYRLTDRLPAGLTSLAASGTAWRGLWCLAMHFTLPAEAYSMAFLREVMFIEDRSGSILSHAGAPTQGWGNNKVESCEAKSLADAAIVTGEAGDSIESRCEGGKYVDDAYPVDGNLMKIGYQHAQVGRR